ncbi:hypothetical protein SAMN04487762_0508 [Polaribacter sp. Hel1_33_78]|jgi:hypothetical protein|uniref:hypothetical protein n=1 Tax=unclassified Polaribacter TaxID=196858 RepID=UPI00052E068B|nr:MULTISPECIES: hypothetical protein [unclassified Polaribacter]KGL59831.1 hypothetical protein PHEL49_0694 [Polaribacter sp. Hel1_33_49]MBT3742942.1 hypothetical protein [Polaribacter sp.]MBT4414347.1 hypothetical protein [Polaribacter sp.]MBT7816428.1 hypothetical protein [Polaribacter sp.]MDG1195511.1 hypothetical protein [Polaribacter sp.]
MSFIEKIKNPVFWSNFVRVVVPFFIIVTLFSLFMNSWREIFAGDFTAVAETNFNDGKWKNFWGIKIFITVFYGLYITNKNMK